jgi:5'-nucleotidase
MKILLTNDDGLFSDGLYALKDALAPFGDVTVVCPAAERSGVAHAITWGVPVQVSRAYLQDGSPAHIVHGTPVDCVLFALAELFDGPPDLVASGINTGMNAGADVFYSGTVSAALEGAFHGVSGVAFSTDERGNAGRMDAVAAQAARVLRGLLELGERAPWAFNVNIPALDGDAEPPVRFTRLYSGGTRVSCIPIEDPYGRLRYWLDTNGERGPAPPDSDIGTLAAGHISVTPLRGDLTDGDLLRRVGQSASEGLDIT